MGSLTHKFGEGGGGGGGSVEEGRVEKLFCIHESPTKKNSIFCRSVATSNLLHFNYLFIYDDGDVWAILFTVTMKHNVIFELKIIFNTQTITL